jgi:hypothetical protein
MILRLKSAFFLDLSDMQLNRKFFEQTAQDMTNAVIMQNKYSQYLKTQGGDILLIFQRENF